MRAGARKLARERGAVETLIAMRVRGAELIADAWADHEDAVTRAMAEQLRIKSRRALKSAQAVRERGKRYVR